MSYSDSCLEAMSSQVRIYLLSLLPEQELWDQHILAVVLSTMLSSSGEEMWTLVQTLEFCGKHERKCSSYLLVCFFMGY